MKPKINVFSLIISSFCLSSFNALIINYSPSHSLWFLILKSEKSRYSNLNFQTNKKLKIPRFLWISFKIAHLEKKRRFWLSKVFKTHLEEGYWGTSPEKSYQKISISSTCVFFTNLLFHLLNQNKKEFLNFSLCVKYWLYFRDFFFERIFQSPGHVHKLKLKKTCALF